MKRGEATASIRALASLGLQPEQFVVALLESMHRVIPSSRNLFDWTDASGRLMYYYVEGPIDHDIARLYFEEFHNLREMEAMPSFEEAVTGRQEIRPAAELDRPGFYGSALYNEIWRPQQLHSRIEAIIRDDKRTPLGSLVLYRARGELPFTRDDEALLAQLIPYIRRGLQARPTQASRFSRRMSHRALITLSQTGELLHLSGEAYKLLLMAHGGVGPQAVTSQPQQAHYSGLAYLYRQFRQDLDIGASPRRCSFKVENAWGRFVFESEPLCCLAGGPPLLGVNLSHLEPEEVTLRRAVDALPVSVTQREVCRLIYLGLSLQDVAKRIWVAPSTVADHVKRIYRQLDVHSVTELIRRIDQAAQTCP